MKKILLIMVILILFCLLASCGVPSNTDTESNTENTSQDTQSTDTGLGENNNSVKRPLEATEEINGYYPYVYAGDFLIDEHKVEDGNYYDECFYEILTYEDFCASVEFPSALSAQDFVDNYVLVLRRCHHSSYDEIGVKDYNSQEQTITVVDVRENTNETEDERIFYYYLLIPRTIPSSYETNNGKKEGALKYHYDNMQQYYFEDRVVSASGFEGYVNIFDNIIQANEFLTNNGMGRLSALSFDNNLDQSKLLAIYVNNSINNCLQTAKSSFLGFSNLKVGESGNIEITLQRSIADNYYGENDKSYLYFIEIPSELMDGCSQSPELNLRVKDHIVSARYPDVTYYNYTSYKGSVNIINDNGNFMVEIDYLDGSKKYVVFDKNRNIISKYNIELIDFELPSNEAEISLETIKAQYGEFVTNYDAGDIGAYITNDACIVYFQRYGDTIYGLYKVDIIENDFEVLWSPDS